ncbi:hypothetical protein LTR91_003340 [Friedmanniomyces endolithicus]|uniref:Uncharacterized protein n=2 Tax=Dothideomycetidae TaxID=451867 RepID=A0A4U0UEY7_9PEZI|nr:hypothetical protein LTS09_012268 [Friedmanniomyces endolithicus]KAK5146100.1 hypothetical protein LTR32_002248 [Rachicladosporium monterosium]KAK0346324.1 hypothetical protein LTR94_007098 [Friedmanniomyces endolithicus]KAK0785210.1 hypothetical protein LTR38_012431 [Friedmanniomyces endolithicus]KAK0808877.1 hypothetical protein LTR75_006131 [Friedmanniomyces endolithicus]
MAALFIGSTVLTATLGLTCGINKLMHRHCFNKDNKRRDLEPTFPAIIHLNGSAAALPAYLAGPGALTILSSADSANESAVFSWGQHGDSAEGVLRGFPAAGKAGFMGGSFSVQIPGLEKPAAGTWISVDRTDESADEETTAKFDAMVKIVEEGKLDEETLEKIFGMGL